uniref:Orf25 n=1 Tax=Staphylococcus aureus TaxID=1280 RepID=Q8VLW6_STAAU|nr:orf25 [Staphylococcus aureus]
MSIFLIKKRYKSINYIIIIIFRVARLPLLFFANFEEGEAKCGLKNLKIRIKKLNIDITRSTKTHSQTNGDVLVWFLIRMVSNHKKKLKGS